MKDEPYKAEKVAVGCLLLFITMPFAIALRGYVIHAFWGWFIAEPFGMSSPGILGCLGIAAFFASIDGVHPEKPKDDERKAADVFAEAIVRPFVIYGFLLGYGWIIHLIGGP